MKHYLINKINYDDNTVIDITARYAFLDKFKENIKFYFNYDILDGETPEMVAYNHYGSTNFWWLVLLFNEITDPFFGWYLTYNQITRWAEKLVEEQWGTLAYYMAYTGTQEEYEGYIQAKKGELDTANDARRTIKLLKPEYIGIVIEQIRKGL